MFIVLMSYTIHKQYYTCVYWQLLVKAAKREQEDQLHYILSAQRCTGLTAEIVKKGEIRIRFETSFNGTCIHVHVYRANCLLSR